MSSCSHKLAFYRICFEIGEMCYFRTNLRTYYGDTYHISQEKNNLGLTIPVYDGTIGVPPAGIHPYVGMCRRGFSLHTTFSCIDNSCQVN